MINSLERAAFIGVPDFLIGLLLGRRLARADDTTWRRMMLFAAAASVALVLGLVVFAFIASARIADGTLVTNVDPRRIADDLLSAYGCVYFTWHVMMAAAGTRLGIRKALGEGRCAAVPSS